MNPERWAKIEDIFQAALDRSGDAREEYIRVECAGDAKLQVEVEKLVARYETEESFLESPVWTDSQFLQSKVRREIARSLNDEIPSAVNDEQSFVGQRVGVYRLTEELGKGGMGVVYLAERADGEFRQKVAVKLVKRGMDTDFIVSRFRHERQILAALNHPNIARLLDGGTTEDGSPYFVMEYIEGEPFLKYCRARKLGLREKLELFNQVCGAIAYAHRRKIIHRDIKPGNILVTEDGAPKLLDFGIAKILDPDLIHESISPTATQMRLMTPEYASPEQVRGEEVTQASDQYSLGVLLYELITGARPYKFPSRAPHEIARVICEEIPSEPSSGEFGKMNGEDGKVSFDADFCRKLDCIVLKTLQKNPSERYSSVADFAADIKRFLRNEPVRAESLTGAANKIEFPSPTINRNSSAVAPLDAPTFWKTNGTAENHRESSAVNSAAGSAPAMPIALSSEKTVSPRRAGVKQGAFLIILSFLLLPILVVLVASIDFLTPVFLFLVFLLVFGGGLIRIIYALFFESTLVPQTAAASTSSFEFGDSSPRINLPPVARPTVVERKRQTGAEENTFGEKSVAVLPLKILSATTGGEPADDDVFLSVGLADALVTRLASVRQLVVRPTSSVLRYGVGETDSFVAGQELNVRYVLDGNIIKTEKRMRVSVQLLDVAEQTTVWAERFTEDSTDVLSLEDSISRRVAESIVPKLTTGEIRNLAKRGTENAKAYEAYLRGRYHWNTFTETSFAQAFVAYHEAIAHDPDYALAHAGIADYYIWLGIFGVLPPSETYQPAKRAALRAIEIDGKLPEAHAALGFARLCGDYDWEQGEADIRRALSLSPNYAIAHNWLAILLFTAARFDEGIEHARRAVELDPLTYQNYRTLSWGFYFSRRFDAALAEIDRTIEKFPLFGVAHANRSWALRAVGRTAEALESSRKAMEISGDATFVLFGHAQSLAADNRGDEALEVVRKIETNEKIQYVSRYQVALVYCYLHDAEKALDALEAALADGEGWLVWLSVEPAIDLLRDEPRFQTILRKINCPSAAQGIVAPNRFERNQITLSEAETVVQPIEKPKRRTPAALKYVLAAIVVAVVGYGLYQIISHTTIDLSATPPNERWKNNFASAMNVKRLTTSGKASNAVLSPDGANIAYVSGDAARQSLWLRPIDSENARQLVAPEQVFYTQVNFSPDGKYIYYIISRAPGRTLYRISTSGGAPEKVSENVFNLFAFSPDGRRIVYDHQNSDNKQHSLFIADLDEKSQINSAQTLFVLEMPNYFPGGFSFSPDGKKIVYPRSVIAENKEVINLFIYDLEARTNEKFGEREFDRIDAAAWRKNGEEIVISAREDDSAPHQLWLVAYPSGKVSRLTNDFTNYWGVSLTADSSVLATTKMNDISNVWTSELSAPNQNYESKARQITSGFDRQDGINGVNWTKDGRILYAASAGAERSITLMNADGTDGRVIPTKATNPKLPLLTSDNRYLVYADEKGQELNIWRFDTANGELAQISSKYAVTPALAPDNRSIVYATMLGASNNKLTVHRKPLDGGEETTLTASTSVRPVVSPDNRSVACNYAGEETNDTWQIAVLPLAGEAAARFIKPYTNNFFRSPQERPLAWSPDGRFLYFLNNSNNVANIFRVAVEGDEPPVQMTHFKSGEIFDFALAPDGKNVVLSRGLTTSDVVIFKNSK